jgi:NAD(P)-dependent dehydrogenase (short-subunit alcohol dehydrogenase family)
MRGATVVVTGGSMGIGYACARRLVREGARVVLCARGRDALERAAAALRRERTGSEVVPVVADVSVADQVERLLDAAAERGGPEGLVHAAAVQGPIGEAVGLEPEVWFDAVRVNLLGTFHVARAACRRMIEGGKGGSIVLLSGGGAATPFPNYTAYACGKVAVVRFAETLALEVARHRIRVNCLAPGFVATRMHQETLAAGEAAGRDYLERTRAELAKGGVPADLAAGAALFLLSHQSAGITGRLLAAPWDDWGRWPEHLEEIREADVFTLRRIVPRDRGKNWQ